MKRFTALFVSAIAVGTVMTNHAIATASAISVDPTLQATQPYEPPDNGGPDGTIGSGTR